MSGGAAGGARRSKRLACLQGTQQAPRPGTPPADPQVPDVRARGRHPAAVRRQRGAGLLHKLAPCGAHPPQGAGEAHPQAAVAPASCWLLAADAARPCRCHCRRPAPVNPALPLRVPPLQNVEKEQKCPAFDHACLGCQRPLRHDCTYCSLRCKVGPGLHSSWGGCAPCTALPGTCAVAQSLPWPGPCPTGCTTGPSHPAGGRGVWVCPYHSQGLAGGARRRRRRRRGGSCCGGGSCVLCATVGAAAGRQQVCTGEHMPPGWVDLRDSDMECVVCARRHLRLPATHVLQVRTS